MAFAGGSGLYSVLGGLAAQWPSDPLELTGLVTVPNHDDDRVEWLGGWQDWSAGRAGAQSRVLPTTAANVRFRSELDAGGLAAETDINWGRTPIRRLSLVPSPRSTPEVMQALVTAHAIVVGPGSLYTDVLPSLLVEGVAATIYGVDAIRIYVANLVTEPGETDRHTLDDHLRVIRTHTRFDLFDYILVNRAPIDAQVARRYAARGYEPVVVERTLRDAGHAQVVEADLTLGSRGVTVGHSPAALARAIRSLIKAGRRFSALPAVGAI